MSEKNNKSSSLGLAGLSLAAIASAAAGAYFFYYGKDGKKNRKKLGDWSVKVKGEVMEKLEQMKDFSKVTYDQAVDQIVQKYEKIKTVDPKQLAELSTELKQHWKNISKVLTSSKKNLRPKKSNKATKKSVKKS